MDKSQKTLLFCVFLGMGLLFIVMFRELIYKASSGQPLPKSKVVEMKTGSSGSFYVRLKNGTMWRRIGDNKWVEMK